MRTFHLITLMALLLGLAACGGNQAGQDDDGQDPFDPNPGDPIEDPIDPDPIDDTQNVRILVSPAMTGAAFSNGFTSTVATPDVGDLADNMEQRGILGFDLASELPADAIIEEAILSVTQSGTTGDGFTSVVNVRVDHLRIPNGTDITSLNMFVAFNRNANIGILAGIQGVGANNVADGPKELDVTAMVQEDLEDGIDRSLFRLWGQGSSANNTADQVLYVGQGSIGTTASLEVTYRLP